MIRIWSLQKKIKPLYTLVRPNYWWKNLLLFVGVFFNLPAIAPPKLLLNGFVAVIALCALSSANYILNVWWDKDCDCYHPQKAFRRNDLNIFTLKEIQSLYLLLLGFGLALLSFTHFTVFLLGTTFLLLAYFYNVPPFRAKDVKVLDILVEALNSPIRFMMGWALLSPLSPPPLFSVLGFWFIGAALMSKKRLNEIIIFPTLYQASLYRRSFKEYSPELLNAYVNVFCLLSLVFFFLGAIPLVQSLSDLSLALR